MKSFEYDNLVIIILILILLISIFIYILVSIKDRKYRGKFNKWPLEWHKWYKTHKYGDSRVYKGVICNNINSMDDVYKCFPETKNWPLDDSRWISVKPIDK